MRRCFTQLGHDRRGGSILEFALLGPVLFSLLLGAIDFGRMFYVRNGLEYATQEAARYYMLNSSSATSTVTGVLQGKMVGGLGPSVNVAYADTTSCNSNPSVTCTTITATYSFTFIANYLGLGTKVLTARSQAIRY